MRVKGPAGRIEPVRPGLFHEGPAPEELTGRTVEHIVESVAVGPEHEGTAAAVRSIDQHRDLERVPIVLVVRGELEMPALGAGGGQHLGQAFGGGPAQLGARAHAESFSRQRFAAAIDMIAAGTSAPMAIAAKATPVNQSGNIASKSAGTAHCGCTSGG